MLKPFFSSTALLSTQEQLQPMTISHLQMVKLTLPLIKSKLLLNSKPSQTAPSNLMKHSQLLLLLIMLLIFTLLLVKEPALSLSKTSQLLLSLRNPATRSLKMMELFKSRSSEMETRMERTSASESFCLCVICRIYSYVISVSWKKALSSLWL